MTSRERSTRAARPKSPGATDCSPSPPCGRLPSPTSAAEVVTVAEVADGTAATAQAGIDVDSRPRRRLLEWIRRRGGRDSERTASSRLASIVYDLDEAVRRWSDQLEIGPWTGYRLEPPRLKDMHYHGAEVEFSFRHAFAWQGELQFELIEPLSGPSIFADHLARHGEGMHHVGTFVGDHAGCGRQCDRGGVHAAPGSSRLRFGG